jgi:two-component system phosphate regulon sensor histidine kinase PhoR
MNDVNSFMHEIENPIGNISNIVDLLDGETDITTIRQYTGLLKQSIQHIVALDKDYKEYRKSGKTSIVYANINLMTVILSVIDEYKALADKYSVKLVHRLKFCKVYTDCTKLRQVLSNLLSNAIKYNKPNGIVTIECNYTLKGAKVIISDSGIGMSPEEIKSLGSLFYRCKKIDVPGTGLGFSLIKKIVDLLGWDLAVKSYNGTTITLMIK